MIESIFVNNVWTLSVDVDCVAGGAGGDKGDRRAVDGDGVAGARSSTTASCVPAAPDNGVAPVIGAGGVAWLLATLPVAVLAVSKKLSPASTAEAATSVVLASVPIDAVQRRVQVAAVAVGVAPMVKLPVGGGVVFVAVS